MSPGRRRLAWQGQDRRVVHRGGIERDLGRDRRATGSEARAAGVRGTVLQSGAAARHRERMETGGRHRGTVMTEALAILDPADQRTRFKPLPTRSAPRWRRTIRATTRMPWVPLPASGASPGSHAGPATGWGAAARGNAKPALAGPGPGRRLHASGAFRIGRSPPAAASLPGRSSPAARFRK